MMQRVQAKRTKQQCYYYYMHLGFLLSELSLLCIVQRCQKRPRVFIELLFAEVENLKDEIFFSWFLRKRLFFVSSNGKIGDH